MSRKHHSQQTLESPHQSSSGLGQHPDQTLRQPLESILTTHELRRRPSRRPDYQAENKVLTSLMREMAGSPRSILRLLAESALKLCRAHSSGISLLEEENGRKIFRWHAAAGQWSPYLGGTMPREDSPCGIVLDRNAPLLFSHPERCFPIPPDVTPAPVEVLLIPFHFADEPIGTIWVVAHDDSRQFDAEDERILTSLGRFASTAYQALASLDALKSQAQARKKAEAERDRLHAQQLREHQLLQRLVERSPVAIAIMRGTDLEFTLANPAYLAITGSSDPIIGRVLLDVFPEARETGADQRLLNVIRTGRPYSLQNTKFVRNQIETWWDGEVLPLKNEAGVVDSALILAWETTARKRAEEALRQSEQRFRRILDALPAAVYTTDPEGRVTHFNSAAVVISGRVPELLTDNWCVSWKLYQPDGTPMPHGQCPMAFALKHGRAIRGAEAVLERPDGTRVPFLAYPTPLRDADGKIVGGINMLVDITERKEAEAATAFLAAIVNHSDDAIISKDLNGVITSWNKGAERLFGYTAQEAIGHPVTMLIPPDRLPEETEILSRIRRGQPMDHFETVRVRKDRSLIEVSLTVSPVRDSKGRIIGASKIARDVTERKKAEEAMRQAKEILANHAAGLERLVNERTAALQETIVDLEAFSYSVAHDMRAPLRAMQSFARILVEEHSRHLNQTATGYLDRIIQSSHRLDRLIQDVLSYTKILQADFPLEHVDLDRLVRDIIGSYPDFHSPHSTVLVAEGLPTVLGNQAWLTQCLSNLLSNAVKFVRPGVPPLVKVFAETLNGHVRVWVEDNGIGISPRDKDRIFRLFERIHSVSEYSGTGIGLTIARKAIERMGGHIGVESELGQGSRFWIELKKA